LKTMEKKESKAFFKIWFLLFVVVVLFPQEAFAPPSRMVARSSSGFLLAVLDVLLLLGVLFCFFSSLKVKSFLKDGELAYGWILFSFSFVILSIAQLFSLSVSSGLLYVPLTIVSLIRLLSILSLALGIYFIKKVLS
ncbi:MAG: hypothetical protein MUO91_00495, partial [candidate division Zixibacteria bacterium]|nr:hypothetical protein [candidate division Zixibacteria bacterium]